MNFKQTDVTSKTRRRKNSLCKDTVDTDVLLVWLCLTRSTQGYIWIYCFYLKQALVSCVVGVRTGQVWRLLPAEEDLGCVKEARWFSILTARSAKTSRTHGLIKFLRFTYTPCLAGICWLLLVLCWPKPNLDHVASRCFQYAPQSLQLKVYTA